ncbi:MAG: O-antigen ligase family protein [Chloroflexota bacterium]
MGAESGNIQQAEMIDWALVAGAALALLGAAIVVARLSYGYNAALPAGKPGTEKHSLTAHTRTASNTILARITQFELPILLLLAPAVLFSSPLTILAVAIIFGLWCIRRITRGYFLPHTPLDWAIALMMVMLPVSLLVNSDIGFSMGKAALLIYGVALYYGIIDWARGQEKLEIAVNLYLLAGGMLALLSLLGTNWQQKVSGLSDIVSLLPQVAQGLSRDQTGFHPNIIAGALLWVVFPLLALTITAWLANRPPGYRERCAQIVLLLLLLLTSGTLLLTQSRAALVAAAVGGVLLLWLAAPKLRSWLAAGAAILVVAVAVIGPAGFTGEIASAQLGEITSTDNLVVRIDVWKSALHAIGDRPLTGIGMDAFRRIMPISYPAPSVPDAYDIGHAHNQLLQAALDLGLPGMVGYLALWFVAAALAVQSYRAAPDSWRRALAAGIMAALLASFLHGLADAVVMVSKPGVLFWALLAINSALWFDLRLDRTRSSRYPMAAHSTGG